VGLHSWANQRDANEPEMLTVLRRIGATWLPLNVKNGPDGVIGFRGKNFIVEFKLPKGPRGGTSHSKQSPGQKDAQRDWRGQWDVIRTVDELLELLTGGPSAIYSKGCR
jgi:hypothetical protein